LAPSVSESLTRPDDSHKRSNFFDEESKKQILTKIEECLNSDDEYSLYYPELLTLATEQHVVPNSSSELVVGCELRSLTRPNESENTPLPSVPQTYGLGNSERIIPAYYYLNKLKPGELFEIDYYEIIKDDIRNMRPLSSYQIKYLKDVSDEEKYEIIEHFNESFKSLVNTLMLPSKPTSPECSIREASSVDELCRNCSDGRVC